MNNESILFAVAQVVKELRGDLEQKIAQINPEPGISEDHVSELVKNAVSEFDDRIKALDGMNDDVLSIVGKQIEDLREDIAKTAGYAQRVIEQAADASLVKSWEPGVYRQGVRVRKDFGYEYQAIKDTASEPDPFSEDWLVVRSGLRYRGLLQEDGQYVVGDLTKKDGSLLMFNGSYHEPIALKGDRGDKGKPGEKGEPGQDGRDGNGLDFVEVGEQGFALFMRGGESFVVDLSGIVNRKAQEIVDDLSQKFVTPAFLADSLNAIFANDGSADSIRFRMFRGHWRHFEKYDKGDSVVYGNALWIAKQDSDGVIPGGTILDPGLGIRHWALMLDAGSGGGGSGGGGAGTTTTLIADGVLNMGGFAIQGLGNPRNGAVGDLDSVNKLYMQQAIAAGTLFQGVYRPAANAPDLPAKGDTGFSGPAANTALFAPPGAPLKPTDPLRVAIWFQVPDVTFPLTLAAPKHVTITLSNGQAVDFNVPAGTYADQNALIAAYLAAAKAANPLILNMIIHRPTGALWMAVETLPAVYATSLSGQIGGGFPVLPPGAKNTILNSYSWNIQTTDPNLPEYLPAGLPGIAAGTKINNSDLLQYNANLNRFEIIRGGNLTQGFADNRYWQLAHGNMAWQDQPYDNGAVVYGQRFNAWFVATQNIVPGSAEPGTTAAGAIWRKINSTYGSTIFFGKGDYDTAHTDAAHNWGMPAGTYPSGQQPLNGDSYYDITSGSEAQFVVTQNNPVFVITGVTTVNTTNQVGTLTDAQMNLFQPAATPLVGQYYYYDVGTTHAASGGAFNGVAFTAGHKYLIVWSGDKDADHNGWVAVDAGTAAPAAASTHNWTINTPHPQAVPDTITPRIVWGYKRVFNITIGASVAADTEIQLLRGIPEANADTHIEIKRTDANGSTYVFDLLTVISGQATLSPIAIKAQDSKFKQILCNWEPGKHFEVGAVVDANAHGTSYQITVTTYDYDIGLVQVGDGVQTMAGKTDQIKADQNYPNEDLQRLLRAASGDATASVVKQGIAPGADVVSTILGMDSGRTYRYKGWAVGGGAQCAIMLSIMASKTDSNQRVDFSKFTNVIGFQTYTDGTTSKIVKFDPKTDGFGTQTGFFGLTAHAVEAVGSICYLDIEIDKRNPTSTVLSSKATYQTGAFNVICQFSCLVPTAEFNGIYFSGIGGAIPKYYICKE